MAISNRRLSANILRRVSSGVSGGMGYVFASTDGQNAVGASPFSSRAINSFPALN